MLQVVRSSGLVRTEAARHHHTKSAATLSWFGSTSAGAGSTGLSGPPGLDDRLEKLASLHERGALSDAEFATAKANLLGL